MKYSDTLQRDYLAELYNRYATLSYGTCMKYLKDPDLAKDATMDVFERLVHDLPKYSIANFKSWLYIVLKNHCFTVLKNQKSHTSLEDASIIMPENLMENMQDVTLQETQNNEETLDALEKAMDQLDTSQKQCLSMFYLEKKSYSEIIDETGLSYNEVKSHIQNGKRNLKIKLMKMIASMVVVMVLIYR